MATPQLNCYLDVPGFLASQPALPVTALLGGNTTLTASVTVGATSLPVITTANFQAGAPVYLLDGPNTEIVFAATPPYTTSGTLLLTAPGCAYAHGPNISVSSGGAQGALGDTLLAAASWVEEYCQQGSPQARGFYATARTEKLAMPTTRAYIDRAYGLMLRPHWFPVTAVTSISIEASPGVGVSFDPTQAEFDTGGMSIAIPQLAPLPPGGYPNLGAFTFYPRGAHMWANLTYTAGFPVGQLPWNFLRAVSFVAREYLAYARNPTGAAMIRQGDVMLVPRLRGSGGKESSVDGIFLAQAKVFLQPYKAQWV